MTVPVVSRPNEDLALIAEAITRCGLHGGFGNAWRPDCGICISQQSAFAALARVQARQQQLEDALRETFDLAAFVNGEDPWYAENEGIDVGAIFARARAALAVSGGRESETGQ